jgi:hypothetical protein
MTRRHRRKPARGPGRRSQKKPIPNPNPFTQPLAAVTPPTPPSPETESPISAVTLPGGGQLNIAGTPEREAAGDERLAELEAMAALDTADHVVRVLWPRIPRAQREAVALTLSHQSRDRMLALWRVLRMPGPEATAPRLPWTVLRGFSAAREELAKAYGPWAPDATTAALFPLEPPHDAAWLRARERHLRQRQREVRRGSDLWREANEELADIRQQLRATPRARVRRAPGGLTRSQIAVAGALANALNAAMPERRRTSAEHPKAGRFRRDVLLRVRALLEIVFGVRTPRAVLVKAIQNSAGGVPTK